MEEKTHQVHTFLYLVKFAPLGKDDNIPWWPASEPKLYWRKWLLQFINPFNH